MKRCRRDITIVLLIMIIAAVLRISFLSARPMHTDEAVNAKIFATLLEEGHYQYNPHDFHGPTLYYFTLPMAKLAGMKRFSELNEEVLRGVPVFFGLIVVLIPLFFKEAMEKRATFFSMWFLAGSPAFVFYSRYYIHEMLFVCFWVVMLGCGYRFWITKKMYWLVGAGIAAGLTAATKETFILIWTSLLLAGLIQGLLTRMDNQKSAFNGMKKWLPLVLAFLIMLIVAGVFYTSFGTNSSGIIELAKSFFNSYSRAMGKQGHMHPWYYYLDLLTWIEFIEPVFWNEDIIVVLAGVGFVLVVISRKITKNPFMGFLAFFTLFCTIIYSIIPYKTPWNVLSFLFGMCLLAGYAIAWLLNTSRSKSQQIIIWCLIVVFVVLSPVIQSVLLVTRFSSSRSNPYVYGHTSWDIFKMTARIEEITKHFPDPRNVRIQVIASGNDYWPWPWYLRQFRNIGYWNHVKENELAQLILIEASLENDLAETIQLQEREALYIPLFKDSCYLRPGVEWEGYIRHDLWEQYIEPKPETLTEDQ